MKRSSHVHIPRSIKFSSLPYLSFLLTSWYRRLFVVILSLIKPTLVAWQLMSFMLLFLILIKNLYMMRSQTLSNKILVWSHYFRSTINEWCFHISSLLRVHARIPLRSRLTVLSCFILNNRQASKYLSHKSAVRFFLNCIYLYLIH